MAARSIDHRVWAVVVVLAVAVRLVVLQAFPGVFDFVETGTVHGSDAYDTYAVNLLTTGVYGREPGVADAAIPPLYSAVLAGAYAAGGRSALTVALLHTACDVTSMALLRSLGAALFGMPLIGTLAAAGMAAYPYLVFQTLAVNDTSLFILLLHVTTWLVVGLRERAGSARPLAMSAAAGVTLGLAALTRPVVLPLAVWASLWWALRLPVRQALLRLAVLGLAGGLVIAGWTARNRHVLGVPVVIATNGGSNFWQGNNPRSRAYLSAGYDVQWISPGPLGAIDHRDPVSNRAFLGEGLRFLREHPWQIPGLAWTKLLVHWSLDVTPRRNPSAVEGAEKGRDRVSDVGVPGEVALSGLAAEDAVALYSQPLFDRYGRSVHRVFWGSSLILACLGSVVWRKAWRDVSLVWLVQLNMTLAYVVFHPSTRYRLPSDPLLMLFSAAGAVAIGRWIVRAARARRETTSEAAR